MDSRTSRVQQQTLASRKRKVVERSVVRVKMGENCGRVKNEGPPSDSWSWRKYGQKPIKGSPFPRGYYRCSTSKGCSAKKQVERCRTDASVLVITYTSTHNHPTNHHNNSNQNHHQPLKSQKQEHTDDEEEEEQESEDIESPLNEEIRKEEDQAIEASSSNELGEEHYFHYIESPLSLHSDQDMMNQDMMMMMMMSTPEFVLDEEPINMISCSIHHNNMMMTSPISEGNDFFDELEELPTALPLITSFTRTNCFQETIPPVHS